MDILDLLGSLYVTFLFLAMLGIGLSELWDRYNGRPLWNVTSEPPQPWLYRLTQIIMVGSGMFFFGLLTASAWGIGPERTPLFPASLGICLACIVIGSFMKGRR